MDVDMARKRREQLNAYADAMNRRRGPLGYSLHDVLGMIAQLHDVPAAPATGIAPVDLTVEAFGEIRATAQRLSGVWRPASQGRTFVWRGVQEPGSLDSCLYQAASTLDTLNGMAQVNAALADAAGLTRPSDAAVLAALLEHLSSRPPGLPEDWLTADTLDTVSRATAELASRLAEIAALRTGRQSDHRASHGRTCPVLHRCLPSTARHWPRLCRPPSNSTACQHRRSPSCLGDSQPTRTCCRNVSSRYRAGGRAGYPHPADLPGRCGPAQAGRRSPGAEPARTGLAIASRGRSSQSCGTCPSGCLAGSGPSRSRRQRVLHVGGAQGRRGGPGEPLRQ